LPYSFTHTESYAEKTAKLDSQSLEVQQTARSNIDSGLAEIVFMNAIKIASNEPSATCAFLTGQRNHRA
jgi:hypothetical protein